ncbi:hypothetical protein GUITHDRAFT_142646 [Guillardia theta CCMP2712]|uniref:Uncharacterized protein n=1 Tax=Guillardia theta (strain CCMP2712) TaxID=905079 RepID=L1IWP7_GUITC|nr:hypothetical protein GUITHDRAFT_142646 [Guillardia theta CCMP2712]EKX40537.1 hypothetical protein GUITHDRAFT_142646 [Guillardia theta CCMP2712]|eukprot:XP_005827517.1 hypothetical protein GUITHDRAFT_142646 [Guillardia theta CCMP2712]
MSSRRLMAAASMAVVACALVALKLQSQAAGHSEASSLASKGAVKVDMEAVHALHSRDPNFPVVSPSEADGNAEALSVEHAKWKSVYPMKFSAKTSHSVPENSHAEWSMKEKQMQRAIHVFHKYGDMALEKLLPPKHKPALRHFEPLRVESSRSSPRSFTTKNAQEAIDAVEKNLEKSQESKIEQMNAREAGLLYAAKTKQEDLTRKFQRQLAREKRRESNLKKELSVVSSENNKLQARNSHLSSLIEKSLRARDKSQTRIDKLDDEISSMKKTEEMNIADLKSKLRHVEDDNKSLRNQIRHTDAKENSITNVAAAHKDVKEQLRTLPNDSESRAVNLATTYLSPEYEKDDRTRSFLLRKQQQEEQEESAAVTPHPVKQNKHENKAIDLASTYLSPEYEKNDRTRSFLLRKQQQEEQEERAAVTPHPVKQNKHENKAIDLASTYLSPEYEKLRRQKSLEESYCEACVTGPDCLSGCRIMSSAPHPAATHKVKAVEAKPAEPKVSRPQQVLPQVGVTTRGVWFFNPSLFGFQVATRSVSPVKPVTQASVWGLGWSAITNTFANLFHL